MSYRLLALDVDGTLLDTAGALSRAARDAVRRCREAGVEVVLCTGRRFRTALPILEALELSGSVVVNNGAVVKEIATARTLAQSYVPHDLYRDVLGLVRGVAAPLVYVDAYHENTDLLFEQGGLGHAFQAEYLKDHGGHCLLVEDLAAVPRNDVIMLSVMAPAEMLEPLRERAHRDLGARVKTHLIVNKNYRGHILEFFSPGSGKWTALRRIAEAAGVAPGEIAAVGDDANDAELLAGAGLGIAMGNATPAVKAHADCVVAGNEAAGVVEAIDLVLSGG